MLGGQRSHVIIERAEEGEPGDEARCGQENRISLLSGRISYSTFGSAGPPVA